MSKNSENVARVFGYTAILLLAVAFLFGVYEKTDVILPLTIIALIGYVLFVVIYLYF